MKNVTREIQKILALMPALLLILGPATASEQEKPAVFVNRIVVDGTINPAVAGFIQDSIRVSHQGSARALVIELDTPGGLLSSTRTIVKDILGAPLPVIVYVAPSGAGAGSAGLFLTLSAHVAVMAPGTHIGAAHPVGGGGQEISGVLGEKLESFVASYGKAIAQQRGRNLDWAVKAIRESVAVTEVEALQLNVVDFVAKDLDDLFHQVTGRQIEVGRQRIVLDLRVEARTLEMSLTQKSATLARELSTNG